jgi:hypothetical protein
MLVEVDGKAEDLRRQGGNIYISHPGLIVFGNGKAVVSN